VGQAASSGSSQQKKEGRGRLFVSFCGRPKKEIGAMLILVELRKKDQKHRVSFLFLGGRTATSALKKGEGRRPTIGSPGIPLKRGREEKKKPLTGRTTILSQGEDASCNEEETRPVAVR